MDAELFDRLEGDLVDYLRGFNECFARSDTRAETERQFRASFER